MEATTGSLNPPESSVDDFLSFFLSFPHTLLFLCLFNSLSTFQYMLILLLPVLSFSLCLPVCFYLFCVSLFLSPSVSLTVCMLILLLCQPNTQGTESCPSTCVPVLFEHSSVLNATLCHYTSMDTILTAHQSHSWLFACLNVLVWSAVGLAECFSEWSVPQP